MTACYCDVFANFSQHICNLFQNLFATLSQTLCNLFATYLQPFCNLVATFFKTYWRDVIQMATPGVSRKSTQQIAQRDNPSIQKITATTSCNLTRCEHPQPCNPLPKPCPTGPPWVRVHVPPPVGTHASSTIIAVLQPFRNVFATYLQPFSKPICNPFATYLQPICNLVLQCICNLFAIFLQTICNRFQNLFSTCLQPICNLFTMYLQPFCNIFATFFKTYLQPFCNLFGTFLHCICNLFASWSLESGFHWETTLGPHWDHIGATSWSLESGIQFWAPLCDALDS